MRRLMKRAAKLTPDDLLQLCVVKGIAAARAASDDSPEVAADAEPPSPGGAASPADGSG